MPLKPLSQLSSVLQHSPPGMLRPLKLRRPKAAWGTRTRAARSRQNGQRQSGSHGVDRSRLRTFRTVRPTGANSCRPRRTCPARTALKPVFADRWQAAPFLRDDAGGRASGWQRGWLIPSSFPVRTRVLHNLLTRSLSYWLDGSLSIDIGAERATSLGGLPLRSARAVAPRRHAGLVWPLRSSCGSCGRRGR